MREPITPAGQSTVRFGRRMARRFDALHRLTSSAGTCLRHSTPPDYVVENIRSGESSSSFDGLLRWLRPYRADDGLCGDPLVACRLPARCELAFANSKPVFVDFTPRTDRSGARRDSSTSSSARSSRSDPREAIVIRLLIARGPAFCINFLRFLANPPAAKTSSAFRGAAAPLHPALMISRE